MLNGKYISFANSCHNLGCKPSGPGDLHVFNSLSNFLTSSFLMYICDCSSISPCSSSQKSPLGSLVKTLAKYSFKIFALTLLLSTVILLVSLGFKCRLEIAELDFVYFQKALGLFFYGPTDLFFFLLPGIFNHVFNLVSHSTVFSINYR